MEMPYVNFKAPVKKFRKDKETGEVTVVSRITFECPRLDDETLSMLTSLSDSGTPVSITIKAAMFNW